MDARAAQARAATGQAYQQGDQRLAGLEQNYMGQANSRNAALQQVLSGFGAGALPTPTNDLGALFGASRAANAGAQTGHDVLYADRGAVNAGLGADILTQQERQAMALQAQIAAQRAASEMQREQELMQLRLQAAQAGVTI